MTEKEALVALNMVPGVGSVRLNRLIGRFRSPIEVFSASDDDLLSVEGIGDDIIHYIKNFGDYYSVEKEMMEAEDKGISIITIYDDDYPPLLKKIFDPPPVLYAAGNFEAIPKEALSLGIVGTRAATDYGEMALQKIIKEMKQTKKDFTIVSGMARGIDSVAHFEALKQGFFTIAVLGFGMKMLHPFTKHYMAKHIIKNGLLIYEFPLAMKPLKQNFPRRNRLISGLSDGVLVIEAGKRSGALITADCALEQGREVFALPGSIFAEKSVGTNGLIAQGAKLVQGAKDIMEEFDIYLKEEAKEPEQAELALMDLNDSERKIVESMGFEKKHIDNIAIESNIDVFKLTGIMTMLELKGVVKQLSGKNFVRTR
jgi:DNA processing protein